MPPSPTPSPAQLATGTLITDMTKRLAAEMRAAGLELSFSVFAASSVEGGLSCVVYPPEFGVAGNPPFATAVCEMIAMANEDESPRPVSERDMKIYRDKFNTAQTYIEDFLNAIGHVLNSNRNAKLQGINGLGKLRQLYERGFPGKTPE